MWSFTCDPSASGSRRGTGPPTAPLKYLEDHSLFSPFSFSFACCQISFRNAVYSVGAPQAKGTEENKLVLTSLMDGLQDLQSNK